MFQTLDILFYYYIHSCRIIRFNICKVPNESLFRHSYRDQDFILYVLNKNLKQNNMNNTTKYSPIYKLIIKSTRISLTVTKAFIDL